MTEASAMVGSDWPFVSSLATVARQAIAASLAEAPYAPPLEGGEVGFGLLVTLKTPDGAVRCCRGHFGGVRGTLVQEVIETAVEAARSEGAPLRAAELAGLSVEIDLLHLPEPIYSLDQLDPARYGLLVEQEDRRGLVLPRLEGIDTVEEQLVLACRSGALDPRLPVQIRRFTIDRIVEPSAPEEAN